MGERIVIIKAFKRRDLWDYKTNKPIPDTIPVGVVRFTEGAVPEGWLKWVPNKIFDRRKCPELYALFGKDHLPNEREMEFYVAKHWDEWYGEEKKLSPLTIIILTITATLTIFGLWLFTSLGQL